MNTNYLSEENANRLAVLSQTRGKTTSEMLEEIFDKFLNTPNHLGISINQLFDNKTKIEESIKTAKNKQWEENNMAESEKRNYNDTIHLWEKLQNENLNFQKIINTSKERVNSFLENSEDTDND